MFVLRSSSFLRTVLTSLVTLLLVGVVAACDSGGGGEADDEGSSIGEQVQAGSQGESGEIESSDDIDHGGITSVPDDPELVEKGKGLFKQKGCQACHQMDEQVTGPALGGVTERRETEWIARMIMHPEKMLEVDPTAKELLAKHATKMPNQNVSVEEAKALIAFLGSQSGGE